mmetsp:Transcript_21610/g.66040  ORF Transcript_21610/g.66040 Transcript_21610/m.66040 type:complete len:359 (-) Transcript_21610:92-1168(-)
MHEAEVLLVVLVHDADGLEEALRRQAAGGVRPEQVLVLRSLQARLHDAGVLVVHLGLARRRVAVQPLRPGQRPQRAALEDLERKAGLVLAEGEAAGLHRALVVERAAEVRHAVAAGDDERVPFFHRVVQVVARVVHGLRDGRCLKRHPLPHGLGVQHDEGVAVLPERERLLLEVHDERREARIHRHLDLERDVPELAADLWGQHVGALGLARGSSRIAARRRRRRRSRVAGRRVAGRLGQLPLPLRFSSLLRLFLLLRFFSLRFFLVGLLRLALRLVLLLCRRRLLLLCLTLHLGFLRLDLSEQGDEGRPRNAAVPAGVLLEDGVERRVPVLAHVRLGLLQGNDVALGDRDARPGAHG